MDDGARPQLDCVLVVGLAACAGGLACAAPVETALAAALLLVALARRGAPIVALLGALAFLVGTARCGGGRAGVRARSRPHRGGPALACAMCR